MKILVIAGIFPPDIGGPASYIPKISQALVHNGHHVTVMSFSSDLIGHDDTQYNFKVFRILRRQNIFLREIKTLWLGYKLAIKHDIIYSNGNDFKAMLVGFLSRKKRVHKIVGDTSWERAQNKNWFQGTIDDYQIATKSWWLKILDKVRALPIQTADQVIVPSVYLQKLVHNWGVNLEKIKVIYNAFEPFSIQGKSLLEPSYHKQDLIKTPFCMITVCRLVPWKGLNLLIQILTEFKELSLVIVGDGDLLKALQNLAKSLNVQDRVLFLGQQPRNKVYELLSISDFFILNSSYEGLPHVVLEAMSCKKLVLASAVGGTVEVVKDQQTGVLFQYNDVESLKKAIQQALTKDNQKIILQSVDLLEKEFSFYSMLNQTEQILYLTAKKDA